MAETVAVLGQSSGTAAASTYSVLYANPTATTTVISTIAVVNTASAAATFRLSLSSASASPALSEHLAYGSTVNANDSVFLTLGVTMTATVKFLMISSSASTVSFSAFGVQVT